MADDPPRKRTKLDRTAMSCDKCRSRKTKCKNPDPGPCDYCKSVNAICEVDKEKRKQRPYYHVSEEEYVLLKSIVRQFIPDTNLDLSTLRNIASADHDHGRFPGSPVSSSVTETVIQSSSKTTENQDKNTTMNSLPENLVTEEIGKLHGDLGCMMVDSSGEYRYVGADSGISFNAAVRRLDSESPEDKVEKHIIPPLKTSALPPATPSSPMRYKSQHSIWLPSKGLCLRYVTNYFRHVHCLYWLYSSEGFHTRLETTYSDPSSVMSISWMCSLCCVLALGSLDSETASDLQTSRKSSDYLALAKSMIPEVCDEADLESVRALILLALTMQGHCFSNNAYLHAGLAVRVAFSLGLHMDKYSLSHGVVDSEHARAIWWTLYNFDQEIALRTGKPGSISQTLTLSGSDLPSEQIINLGSYTPHSYLQVSNSLTKLTKRISKTVYPAEMASRVAFTEVTGLLSSLKVWLAELPGHLLYTKHITPLCRRCTGLLHVRYWSVVILATRPFLLCSVLRRDEFKYNDKKGYFDELSNVCIDAAGSSLVILRDMQHDGNLSSRLPLDFNYLLELIQVFLIADAFIGVHRYIENVREILDIMRSMDIAGWCEKALPEVEFQLSENGVLEVAWEDPSIDIPDFGFLMGSGEPSFGNSELYVVTHPPLCTNSFPCAPWQSTPR